MFGILICLIKMFHRHFSRYGQKADLKTLPRGRWSQRCEFNFNPAPSSPAGRRLLVHTLESPNQPQPPSWENAGADWGRICPINRGRTDRWLAPREPVGLRCYRERSDTIWRHLSPKPCHALHPQHTHSLWGRAGPCHMAICKAI